MLVVDLVDRTIDQRRHRFSTWKLFIQSGDQIGGTHHEQITLVWRMIDTTGATTVGCAHHIAPLDTRVLQHDGRAHTIDYFNAVVRPQLGGGTAVGQYHPIAVQYLTILKFDT
ncbi:hypothetical protein D3C81_1390690 [compost metagenome]